MLKSYSIKKSFGRIISGKNSLFLLSGIILLLCFLTYSNSLSGSFIWDDYELIVENPFIRTITGVKAFFYQDIAAGAGERFNYYRPLQMLTYALDHALWGLRPWAFRLSNILLHGLVGIALFFLFRMLTKHTLTAWVAALLYITHPIHTEAVVYISGRADPLAMLFCILSFIAYLHFLEKNVKLKLYLSLALFLLAILSRENTLLLPLLLYIYHKAFKIPRPTAWWLFPAAVLLYALLRLTFFTSGSLPISVIDWIPRLPGFFIAQFKYLQLLLVPYPLHMEYGVKYFSFTHPLSLLGCIITLVIPILAWRTKKFPVLSFGLMWYWVSLLPVCNIYPLNAYMAEHWLYLPSAGLFLIAGTMLNQFIKSKWPRALVTLIAICFYTSITAIQNTTWHNPIPFFKRTLKFAPDSVMIHTRLGIAYLHENRLLEASRAFQRALHLNPDHAPAINNLGSIYHALGDLDKAYEAYKIAAEKNPTFEKTWINFGHVALKKGDEQQAEKCFQKSLKINPNYAPAYAATGDLFKSQKKYNQATTHYLKALELNHTLYSVYITLIDTYFASGELEQAKRYIDIGRSYFPQDLELLNKLAVWNIYADQPNTAIKIYETARNEHPNYYPFCINLGILYAEQDKFIQSIPLFEKAITTNPKSIEAHQNLAQVYQKMGNEKKQQEIINKLRNIHKESYISEE